MSSALFNRGIHTQLGMRQRAERIDKELHDLRARMTVLNTPVDSTDITMRLESCEAHIATMKATIDELFARLEKLEKSAEKSS